MEHCFYNDSLKNLIQWNMFMLNCVYVCIYILSGDAYSHIFFFPMESVSLVKQSWSMSITLIIVSSRCMENFNIIDLFERIQSFIITSVQFSSVTQSCWTLRPHGLQHVRRPCPSPTSGVYSNSCPLSWWRHPTISSSVITFSSCLQSFPAWESFPMGQFFASDGLSIGLSSEILFSGDQGFCLKQEFILISDDQY